MSKHLKTTFLLLSILFLSTNHPKNVEAHEARHDHQQSEKKRFSGIVKALKNRSVAAAMKQESRRASKNQPKKARISRRELYRMPKRNIRDNYTLIKGDLRRTNDILYDQPNANVRRFLLEIAMVESELGSKTQKYKKGGVGGKGVWQIQRNAFRATKDIKNNPQLIPYLERLKRETGIDWIHDVRWEHCNYVFYGAIAAQLYLIVREVEPRNTTAKRAVQWKKHYNTYQGSGHPNDYIRRVKNNIAIVKTAGSESNNRTA